jgi:hypothetical protein
MVKMACRITINGILSVLTVHVHAHQEYMGGDEFANLIVHDHTILKSTVSSDASYLVANERFCVPLRLGANWGYWPSLRPGRMSPSQATHVSHLDGVFCLPLA